VPGIVVVEDEYIVALDIRSFLERSGYSVAGVFASGEELLDRLDALAPDLILMDIKIRGALDGVETARIVQERRRVPVVLLTAYADDETVARAKMTQPFGYILKPFEERELRTAIEIALYRAGMEEKLRRSEERFRRLFNEGIWPRPTAASPTPIPPS
jgi:CheY-like chemotaxis protein